MFENISQAYMLELYQDTLMDLLLPKNAKRLKLDIKKDSKVNLLEETTFIVGSLIFYLLLLYPLLFILF